MYTPEVGSGVGRGGGDGPTGTKYAREHPTPRKYTPVHQESMCWFINKEREEIYTNF